MDVMHQLIREFRGMIVKCKGQLEFAGPVQYCCENVLELLTVLWKSVTYQVLSRRLDEHRAASAVIREFRNTPYCLYVCLQCSDAVGWVSGRASGL